MPVDLSWWTNIPAILDDPHDILRRYIVEPQLPIFEPQVHVLPRKAAIEHLYHVPSGIASTTLVPRRDAFTHTIVDYAEEAIVDADSTATNSMSLRRAPGPPETATKGSAVNYPFWPGGFDESLDNIGHLMAESIDFETVELLTEAPGFPYGIDFKDESFRRSNGSEPLQQVSVDLLSFVDEENRILGLWREQEQQEKEDALKAAKGDDHAAASTNQAVYSAVIGVDDDELLDTAYGGGADASVLKISDTIIAKSMEWAEMLDVTQPVVDFELRIPNPAYKYPFELDIFQKQAIMKLEEHSHVFVAAHTSAGKTVVAEYAIALSKQHMTRTIYTSPIKALSNQKYHDFKEQFKDVGLITGDIQIDPTASCLIMTTEILRSMLYCGSEVTRDLEYVIFDEVHYITDPDRGYVWEEVLILLPDHVSIVMLSATVPNTLEFANWVGQTKKRKVFVCSTLKRPIPLMHYLYTGSGGKSKNDIFLLVNGQSEFSIKGYREAIAAKERDKSASSSFKSHQMNPKQEQNMWIGMIDHLKRNDKLPVVCFTLSRNRCDRNLQALQSVDLCTAKEAGYNYYFVQKCVQQLKPEDRKLPQVLTLQDSLRRGIGVHHSGILPILKEIVEILFQKGHVKLLFATETFAMGVNMPARTVIFDNLRKFDGVESRMLRPAEYTQMAGRAGRRGKDATGTVIMLCKGDVPAETDLRTMILGKPMRLESQFRLTYAMILNLLRVESVSVEDMMSHSFMEFGSRTRLPEQREQLRVVEERMAGMQALSEHMRPLSRFYEEADEYARLKEAYMTDFIAQGQIGKELKPGRILIINQGRHYNKLALLLSMHTGKEIAFSVLVLDDQVDADHDDTRVAGTKGAAAADRSDLWHKMLSLTNQHKHYLPEGIGGHTVLTVKARDIVEVTKTTMKAETDKILQNWQQRQIPRFRDSPPGPTVVKVVNELFNLNNDVFNARQQLAFFDVKKDLDMQAKQAQLVRVRKRLAECIGCTSASNFELEFALVFDHKKLEHERDQLRFDMSKESFALYPDYMRKLAVLRELQYIDDQHEVTMKGRVACEMGSNELIITELVLCNTFTDLEPDEIPALLSSLVFQAKTDVAPVLTPNLEKCIAAIKQVNESITSVEARHNVTSSDVTMAKDRLNFGLVEVVYEWARNKSFAEIIQLTDIQEGIIVRCIQQLNETIQDVKDAARIIGNPVLHKKMEDASNAIQRNIVFTASLYFQN